MKILDIARSLDETYDCRNGSFCEHFLKSLNLQDPMNHKNIKTVLSTLQTASVAMKQLTAKCTEDEYYDIYIDFSDTMCILSSLMQLCYQFKINNTARYIESFCVRFSLAEFKQELLYLQSIMTPSYLSVVQELGKECELDLKLWMYTTFENNDIHMNQGAVEPNRKGLKSSQVSYISDEANFKSILKRKPVHEMFPVIMMDDCPACTETFRSGGGSLKQSAELTVPVVVLKR